MPGWNKLTTGVQTPILGGSVRGIIALYYAHHQLRSISTPLWCGVSRVPTRNARSFTNALLYFLKRHYLYRGGQWCKVLNHIFPQYLVLFGEHKTKLILERRTRPFAILQKKIWLQFRFTRYEPFRSIPTHSDGSYSAFSLFAIRYPFPYPRLGHFSAE